MAFKLKPPYTIDNTPIYTVNDEDGVLGRTNNSGTILINKDVKDKDQLKKVIEHEKVHVQQIKDGRLSYDDKNIIWEGKKYPLKYDKNSPWEKEAYKKNKKKK
jgi:hypothetical protein